MCSEGWCRRRGQRLVGVGVRLDCRRMVAVAPERVPPAPPGAVAAEGEGLAVGVVNLLAAAHVVRRVPTEGALARAGGATDLGITPRLPFRSEWRESSAHLHLDLDGSESRSLRQTRSVAQRFQERERKGAGGTGAAGNLVDMSCRSPTTSPQ